MPTNNDPQLPFVCLICGENLTELECYDDTQICAKCLQEDTDWKYE
jgi:hypothetical protein